MAHNLVRLQKHFVYSHCKAKIDILQEVPEPLPWCTNCSIHMSVYIMERHKQTTRYNIATEMRLRRRDLELAYRSGEMQFSLYGVDGCVLVEVVPHFKYLGKTLYQSDNNWPVIIQIIRRSQKVWGRLGKILPWEGSDTQKSNMFYWLVVKVVLLFCSELRTMLQVITSKLEGTHIVFLRDITGNRAQRTTNGTWETPASGEVLRAAGMQTEATYIGQRQGRWCNGWLYIRSLICVHGIICSRDGGGGGDPGIDGNYRVITVISLW